MLNFQQEFSRIIRVCQQINGELEGCSISFLLYFSAGKGNIDSLFFYFFLLVEGARKIQNFPAANCQTSASFTSSFSSQ